MLSLEGVISFLLARGLIHERRIVDGDILVLNASRRNLNFKVVSERSPGYLIKQGVGADKIPTVAREAAVYQFFGSHPLFQPLSSFLPHCYSYDPEECTLVLELVEESQSLAEYHRRHRGFPIRHGSALGEALGTLHRLTGAAAQTRCGGQFPGRATQFLQLHQPNLGTFVRMSGATVELIRIVQHSADLCRLLEELRGEWREEAVIHGDLRWDNCHVARLPSGGPRVGIKLVDWEMAGVGDPCWDIGTVFSEHLKFWLLSTPMTRETLPEEFVRLTRFPLQEMQPAMRAFWRSYVHYKELDESQEGEWLLKSVRYAAARLILSAYEDMQTATRVTPHAIYLLQLSLNLLKRPLEAARQLLRLPVPAV